MHRSILRSLAAATTLALLSGCAGSPSIRDAETVSVRLYDESEYQLIMRGGRRPNSEMNAGTGAVGLGTAAFVDCASATGEPITGLFVGSFCAAAGAIIGGIAGAGVSAVESMDDPGVVPGTSGATTPSRNIPSKTLASSETNLNGFPSALSMLI